MITRGIYKITCAGKVYIGQTIDMDRRLKQHIYNSSRVNTPFYRALRTQKWDFTPLEQVDKANMNKREIYWIDHYDSFRKGWNRTIGGDNDYNSSIRKLREQKNKETVTVAINPTSNSQ